MDDQIFKDAEEGNPYAMLGLAYQYHYGKYVEQDFVLALKWYVLSAEAGCPRAKWELAKNYRDGVFTEPDREKYLKYLRDATDAGIPEAQVELGVEYIKGGLVPVDPFFAFRLMSKAADQEYPIAMFMRGYMCGCGLGTPKDEYAMERFFSALGFRGDAELFLEIGMDYEYGFNGMKIDLIEAGRWYKNGADMGHEKCVISWNCVLEKLNGSNKETFEERLERFSHTMAEQEKRQSAHTLEVADHYMEEEDYEKAMEYYLKSAEHDNPIALFTLALMYHDGITVRRNDRTSLDLLSKASMAGSEDAQYTLGDLYEKGRIAKKDRDEAIKFFSMAAANGYLVGYYRLTKYMDHPEIYVRKTNTVVR